jgi:hypothetical protein
MPKQNVKRVSLILGGGEDDVRDLRVCGESVPGGDATDQPPASGVEDGGVVLGIKRKRSIGEVAGEESGGSEDNIGTHNAGPDGELGFQAVPSGGDIGGAPVPVGGKKRPRLSFGEFRDKGFHAVFSNIKREMVEQCGDFLPANSIDNACRDKLISICIEWVKKHRRENKN